MTNEEIKQRTLELYSLLPQEEEARKSRIDIRDQIIQLNMSFFGYVASKTFINNSMVTYEDKFQSAVCHFLTCWWWYKWEGHYRTDLSFAVFFRLRIGEMIERELNTVKYSTRRDLCMEVGKQLGKHWGQVKYEDLSNPRLQLPVDKMNSLKAIFGTLYMPDIEEQMQYLEAPKVVEGIDSMSDCYDSIEELLVREMIDREERLKDSDLLEIADMYQVDFATLKSKRNLAESILYKRLHDIVDLRDTY